MHSVNFCFITAVTFACAYGSQAVLGRLPSTPVLGERLERIERLLGISPVGHTNRGCPPSFRRFQSSCYHFGIAPITWHMAKIACRQMGAKLVSVETYPEDDFILRNIKSLSESSTLIAFWTSGNDLSRDNHWIWDSTGQEFGNYRPWSPGQPNAGDGQCLIYYAEDLWRWHDLPCTVNQYKGKGTGFICEKDIAMP